MAKCGTHCDAEKLNWWALKKVGGRDSRQEKEPKTENDRKRFAFCQFSYLKDLEDAFLVDGQAGKGIFAEALGEGTKWMKTICIDLQNRTESYVKIQFNRVRCS